MKANELMVGDWVFSKSDDKIYKINSIITQDDGSVLLATEDGLHFDYMYEAIPITAEILEKNGFEWLEKDIEYILTLGGTFEVRAEVVNDLMWNINVYYTRADIEFYELQYVHELQHALRLCGVEKEIILLNYEQYRENTDKEQSEVV